MGFKGPPKQIDYDVNSLDVKQRTTLWEKSEAACGKFSIE
jgi:hypothetical protein